MTARKRYEMNRKEMFDKNSRVILASEIYDAVKFVAQCSLPGLGVLCIIIDRFWGLPNILIFLEIIIVLDVFLGLCLCFLSRSYYNSDKAFDGSLDVEQIFGGPKVFSLNLNSDPEDLENKKKVVFKVQRC